MTDPTLSSSTGAYIIRESRTCLACKSTAVVDITRVDEAIDTWGCPVCRTTNTEYVDDRVDADEVDPDSWHDAMHEED